MPAHRMACEARPRPRQSKVERQMTTQSVRDPATGQHPTNTREIAKHWIDGEWIGSDAVSESINPATGEVLGRWSDGGEAEARAAVEAARRAFDTSLWPRDRNL